MNKFTTAVLATAVALGTPLAASAATIKGQLDISGKANIDSSDFTPGGTVDLRHNGIVILADGDFADEGIVEYSTLAHMMDFQLKDFQQVVYTVMGFTFTANQFSDITVDGDDVSFNATGIISHADYDDTVGYLNFTTQSNVATASFSATTTTPVPLPAGGVLILTALGGLAIARKRKKAA
ncbi:VPLPA-CTERM sorting domain-containing protein [Arenibacterium halophilum]|uniref:VPLPA-CTERM sorting domain-containing protein n=1 Tax=Arenibacterium halophilum TaxID=2583821 RepID=A0ABY2XDQ5_9RHOB|nr:VPLPA-CTERM sorting domain-containing protein [Arenibacterium halophilum]TMV15160.1 VPLPA-CTERM sorting domain-containing protein [Arenibacterium halophilum]